MSFSTYLDQAIYDYRISNGQIVLSRGSNSVRDRLLVSLYTQQGEWYLNSLDGIDYYSTNGLLGGEASGEEISAVIRSNILEDVDVVKIDTFEILENKKDRKVDVNVFCQVNATAFDGDDKTRTIEVQI